VFKSICISGQSRRLSLALLALGCLSTTANAQTAPQLLPYTTKLIAGGGTAVVAKGATCPVSGFTSLDAYGDGCLATEVLLGNNIAPGKTPGPRAAVADAAGNVFFGDYNNGLVRRVDVITGVVNAVAGGATASPGSGTACGTGISTDSLGDGCSSTLVKLSHPTGMTFAPNGDLYFADYGNGTVRKITATGGFIPATGGTIALIAGSPNGTYGYNVSNATTTVTAAQSILDGPYSIAFDNQNDLVIADEYNAAIVAVNLNTTGTNVLTGVSIAAGTIWKIAGTLTTGGPYCPSSGCTYNHVYTDGLQANYDWVRNAYGVTVDPNNNVYITNEYYDTIQKVATSGILTTYIGTNNAAGHALTRGVAPAIAIGSPFGVVSDTNGNIYFTDAADGTVWRVDAGTQNQYLIASGFGSTNSGGFASATLPGPGIFAISVDSYADVFFGDTENNAVSEIASGTQFGPVGANQPVQTVEIHFAPNDSPAANAYKLTTGATNFSLGSATCTANSDKTVDCLLPITATPSVLGLFTGTLQVTSTLGGVGSFYLSGTYVQSPVTRTAISYTSASNCSGTSTYATTNPITFTATLVANGPAAPGGTITFFSNNGTSTTTLATVNVSNIGTTTAPVYGATYTYTFSTVGSYSVSATYSGDTYFKTSSTKSSATLSTSLPSFSTSLLSYQQNTVSAGQTGLFSFNIAQTVYTGTISFACSGLPANSSCSFSPVTVVAAGCSTTSTVALSILTQQAMASSTLASIGTSGSGPWQLLSVSLGLGLALLVGLRRRHLRFGRVWMSLALLLAASGTVACGNGTHQAATPTGSYSITVTATGSNGTTTTIPLTLVVH